MKKRYGKVFNNQSKRQETCLEKYGVKSPTQVPEIFHKIQMSGLTLKKFKNYDLYYRGSYEYNFLELCEKINILPLISNSKTIHYVDRAKNCVYYPDFYFSHLNLIVEIKSDYTYRKGLYKNQKKRNACIEQGYKFMFIIDNDFKKFITLIQQSL